MNSEVKPRVLVNVSITYNKKRESIQYKYMMYHHSNFVMVMDMYVTSLYTVHEYDPFISCVQKKNLYIIFIVFSYDI